MSRKVDPTDVATIILGGLASIGNPFVGILVAAGVYTGGRLGLIDFEKLKNFFPDEIRHFLVVQAIAWKKLSADLENSSLHSPTALNIREGILRAAISRNRGRETTRRRR